MIGLVPGSNFTKLSLHELGGRGRSPEIKCVDSASRLTTRDIPLPLVRNLMSLHESAVPGSVKGFAKTVFKVGLMEELITDAIDTRSQLASPSKRVDMKNPEKIMEAFYAASFLQNDEAKEFLVYSQEGRVVGMAQIGNFVPKMSGLSCTISNLVISPKLDPMSQQAVIQHIASAAKKETGEATLLTSGGWSEGYRTHGFAVEEISGNESPRREAARRDPVGTALLSQAALSSSCTQEGGVVRCRWTG